MAKETQLVNAYAKTIVELKQRIEAYEKALETIAEHEDLPQVVNPFEFARTELERIRDDS